MLEIVIYTHSEPTLPTVEHNCIYHSADSLKQLKTLFRRHNILAIIFEIHDQEKESEASEIQHFLRKELDNNWLPLYIVNMGGKEWRSVALADFDIAGYYKVGYRGIDCIQKEIERNLNSLYIMSKRARVSALQTSFLMSVNQFSHSREPLDKIIETFTQALHDYCSAQVSFNITLENEQLVEINEFPKQTYPPDELLDELYDGLIPLIEKAKQGNSPQIEFVQDSPFFQKLRALFSKEIKAYLIFPISAYGYFIGFVFCALKIDGLTNISVSSLNVLKESAKQLSILLERRCADSKIKSRYLRLKTTLSALLLDENYHLQLNKETHEVEPNEGRLTEEQGLCAIINLLDKFEAKQNLTPNLVQCLENHDDLIAYIDANEEQLKQRLNAKYAVEDIVVLLNNSREALLRMRDLISDLNSFAQIKDLEITSFNLQYLLEETLRLVHYEVKDSVSITLEINENIELNTHRGFFQQILLNLIKNALQAVTSPNAPKDVSPLVLIRVAVNEQMLKIIVKDNGHGIAENELNKVFMPFFTSNNVGHGIGLGLSITHSLIVKLGGEIKVSSEVNQGAQFTLTFPLNKIKTCN